MDELLENSSTENNPYGILCELSVIGAAGWKGQGAKYAEHTPQWLMTFCAKPAPIVTLSFSELNERRQVSLTREFLR
jgi:hypothetical protein